MLWLENRGCGLSCHTTDSKIWSGIALATADRLDWNQVDDSLVRARNARSLRVWVNDLSSYHHLKKFVSGYDFAERKSPEIKGKIFAAARVPLFVQVKGLANTITQAVSEPDTEYSKKQEPSWH